MAIEQSFFDELEKVDIIYYDQSVAYFNKNRLDQYTDKAKRYDQIVPLFKKLWSEYKDYPPCVGTLEESLFKEIESIINQEKRKQE